MLDIESISHIGGTCNHNRELILIWLYFLYKGGENLAFWIMVSKYENYLRIVGTYLDIILILVEPGHQSHFALLGEHL